MWYVYIVRCADRTLYTGVAKDVAARVAVHNEGRGAKYTRARRPVRSPIAPRRSAGSMRSRRYLGRRSARCSRARGGRLAITRGRHVSEPVDLPIAL
jgi:putative endonuclease